MGNTKEGRTRTDPRDTQRKKSGTFTSRKCNKRWRRNAICYAGYVRTHALGLETNVAVLVANTMMDGNANFYAEVTLSVDGHEKLNGELMWARKDIAGLKKTVSTALADNELGTDSHATLCSKQQTRYYERLEYDRPPRWVRSIRNFLISETPRVELGKKYDTRSGWSALKEIATKRQWRAPQDWGK